MTSVAAWGAGDAAGAGVVTASWAVHFLVCVGGCLKVLRCGKMYALVEFSMFVSRLCCQNVKVLKKGGIRDCLVGFIDLWNGCSHK